jgi:hypothetical protein
MATFHFKGKSNIAILVGDSKIVQITKQCFRAMFGFQLGSVHLFKNVVYVKNKVVINSIYQVPSSSTQGLHWMVNVGKYQM